MCMVTVYRQEQEGKSVLWEDVQEFEISLGEEKITLWNIMGQKREYDIKETVKWSADGDNLVIV